MSDYRAIAGVSNTLQKLLQDRMQNETLVTIAPPEVAVGGAEGQWVNLYLYHLTINPELRNQDLLAASGSSLGHPPLALNLYYLITAHGGLEEAEESDVQAQLLLGDAMRVIHDFPIVTEALRIHRPAAGTPGDPILDPSLREQSEQVKLTFEPLSMDDVSKIWTAISQANFRRSVAYEVSVIRIESQQERTFPRPVATRRVHTAIVKSPQIRSVYRTPVGNEPDGDGRLAVGDSLVIRGYNFSGERTWVRIGSLELIQVTPANDREITIALPDEDYPVDPDHGAERPIPPDVQLQPGPQTVEVITEIETEVVEGSLGHGAVVGDLRTLASNQAIFMLVPEIIDAQPARGVDPTVMVVTGQRLYHSSLTSWVVIGDRAFAPLDPSDPNSPPGTVRTAAEVHVQVSGLEVGTYMVRARVNGAESMQEDKLFEVIP